MTKQHGPREHMVRHPKGARGFAEADMNRYHKSMRDQEVEDVTGDSMSLEEAMREVHTKTPHNVVAAGKTGKAKEKMLRAIAFSKAGQSRK